MSASKVNASARVRAESARRPLNVAKPGIFALQSAKAVSQSASDLKRESRSQVSCGLTLPRGGRAPAAEALGATDLPLLDARDCGLDLVLAAGRACGFFFIFDGVLVEVLAMAGCGNAKRGGGQ